MRQNEHPPSLQGVPNKDIKMAALSLTEEIFSIIQGYSYVESMKYISPGRGQEVAFLKACSAALNMPNTRNWIPD